MARHVLLLKKPSCLNAETYWTFQDKIAGDWQPLVGVTSKAMFVEFSTYREALAAIWNRSGYDRGFISNPFAGDNNARLGLERTQQLLDRTGHTTLPYKIVHVAGSKGKGSTSTMIDSILRAANVRTGRYLSPHLHSFRERFVVNGELISEQDFVEFTRAFIDAANQIESDDAAIGPVTAFELTTAMALAWFAQQGCDVAVVEVGMGGGLDSTNIVHPAVSVITTLDFEHTGVLGTTMAEIAANKAGIIKYGQPVLTAQQPAEALDVISAKATSNNAPLFVDNRDWHVEGDYTNFTFGDPTRRFENLKSGFVGDHQVHNAGLAIAAVLALRERNPELNIDEAAIRTGIADAQLPGRFERVQLPTGQTLIIDGAHTPASTSALAAAVRQMYPDSRTTIVFGMLADKDSEFVLTPLKALAAHWIVTQPANPRALPAKELHRVLESMGEKSEIAASVEEGIETAMAQGTDLIVVTGSFATATEARVALDLVYVIDPPM